MAGEIVHPMTFIDLPKRSKVNLSVQKMSISSKIIFGFEMGRFFTSV